MVNAWHDVKVGDKQPQFVNAIIEIPKDSKVKYELDKETGLLKLDRYMFSAVHYPGDYGFIPQTLWEDGDPLDVFVITHRETYPMALCEVKVIGVIRMDDGGESDDKILAVHNADPRYNQWDSIEDVPKHFLSELHNFLETYKALENKQVLVYEVLPAKDAYETITRAIEMYNTKYR